MKLISDFRINRADIVDNSAYVDSDTRNLRFLSRKTTGQRYEFRLRSVELDQFEIKRVMAFIASVQRDNSPIEIFIPMYSESSAGNKTSNARAIGDYDATLNNITGIAIGDFMTFAGHAKAYEVTAINGNVIEFAPNLMRPVSSSELVKFSGMEFTVKLRNRPQRFTTDAERNSAVLELDVIEVWS